MRRIPHYGEPAKHGLIEDVRLGQAHPSIVGQAPPVAWTPQINDCSIFWGGGYRLPVAVFI
jgi:hypothetical protein